jgi:thymidylate synthase
MFIKAATLDDLLREVYKRLLASNNRVNPRRGNNFEETGVLLELKNPRARLSRTESRGKIFSCLGELLWYLSGTNDLAFISYYIPRYTEDSEDKKTIYGGYGPRLFRKRGQDQVANVTRLLQEHPDSRRAVIQLFDSDDLANSHKEIPCTCVLQFILRKNRLHMLTSMRSNDAYLGLPHDVFCFTMIQEILARSLSVELGTYKHFVGSLHLYEKNFQGAGQYLEEGWQSTKILMPSMPKGDPWPSIKTLLIAEANIRGGAAIDLEKLGLDPYWADLVRLLQILRHYKDMDSTGLARIKTIRGEMSSPVYNSYIERQQRQHKPAQPTQEELNLPNFQ